MSDRNKTAPVPQKSLREAFSTVDTAPNVANNNATNTVNNDKIEKRKSLGRRVSFAATAKVRVFEKQKDSPAPNGILNSNPFNDEEAEDDVFNSLVNERRTSFINDENDPFNAVPTNQNPFPASPAVIQSKQAIANATVSPGGESVSSFEIDIKEGTDMSLIVEEEEAIVADSELEDEIDAMSMDFTQTVGRMSTGSDMDMTQPISSFSNRLSSRPSIDEAQGMDLTTCIGGLLKSPKPTQQVPSTPSKDVVMQVDEEGDAEVKMQAQKSIEMLMSPSPFWPASPQTAAISSTFSPLLLIGKEERPAAFNFTASPLVSSKLNTEIIVNQPQITKNISIKSNDIVPSLPVVNNNNNSTAEELFKQFINQDNLGGSLKPSNLGSPKNSNEPNLKKADLKEFLNECGVRFLDNLTSLNRRETNSRPRDSSISAVPGRSLTVMSTSVPEGEIVEKASEVLTQKILGAKDQLEKLENQFNISPPQFYPSACKNNIEQSSLRLKILKSVSRLVSKQEWYQWRRLTIESVINNAIEKNLTSLLETEQKLDFCLNQFSSTSIISDQQLEVLEKELSNTVNNLKERIQTTKDSKEQERAQFLTGELADATSILRQTTNELESLTFQENSLKLAIGQYQEEKRKKQSGIETCKKYLTETLDVNEASLQELKSQLAMQSALVRWKWVTIRPDELVLEWQKTGPVRVRFELCSPGAVKAVQINSASAVSRILKYSSRLILVEAGHSVPKVISFFINHR
jgi:hypothetical protein